MELFDWKSNFDESELPLRSPEKYMGFASIFRKLACIGDSLSSGEFESTKPDGQKGYHDFFDHSWGQYLARKVGITVYNSSRGGMSAKEYMESFAASQHFFTKSLDANAFLIALGVNDMSAVSRGDIAFGEFADIPKILAGEEAEKSFLYYYLTLLLRCRSVNPDAPLFLMTMPRTENPNPLYDRHRDLLIEFCKVLPNTYLLDLRTYAPVYDAAFRRAFYLGGHLNPQGYVYTANLVAYYLDFIVRHNMRAFAQIGFQFTDWRNTVDV